MLRQYIATKLWMYRFLVILNTLAVTVFQKTYMNLSRISRNLLENPDAHYFRYFLKHHWIERQKLPLLTKFQIATGLSSRSNQRNTSKISEKWENEPVFRVFDIFAHLFSIFFDCHQIELEKLIILAKFESAFRVKSSKEKPI